MQSIAIYCNALGQKDIVHVRYGAQCGEDSDPGNCYARRAGGSPCSLICVRQASTAHKTIWYNTITSCTFSLYRTAPRCPSWCLHFPVNFSLIFSLPTFFFGWVPYYEISDVCFLLLPSVHSIILFFCPFMYQNYKFASTSCSCSLTSISFRSICIFYCSWYFVTCRGVARVIWVRHYSIESAERAVRVSPP